MPMMCPWRSIRWSTLSNLSATSSYTNQLGSGRGRAAFCFSLCLSARRSRRDGPGLSLRGKDTDLIRLNPIWCGVYVFEPVVNIRYFSTCSDRSSLSLAHSSVSIDASDTPELTSSTLSMSASSEMYKYPMHKLFQKFPYPVSRRVLLLLIILHQ